jgi:hypothetical protein
MIVQISQLHVERALLKFRTLKELLFTVFLEYIVVIYLHMIYIKRFRPPLQYQIVNRMYAGPDLPLWGPRGIHNVNTNNSNNKLCYDIFVFLFIIITENAS